METLTDSLAESGYQTLRDVNPTILRTVGKLLDAGQTIAQICRVAEQTDVALAGLIELAATHMKATGVRSLRATMRSVHTGTHARRAGHRCRVGNPSAITRRSPEKEA